MKNINENKIAIMQPTFIPWIGYFALIEYVDTFIFLDSVQFDKRSWQQRNKIKTSNGLKWLTIPVLSKGKYKQKIKEVEIDNGQNFPEKVINTITANYSKSKFFNQYSSDIFSILVENKKYLVDLNIELIKYMMKIWNFYTPIIKSSDLEIVGSKDELLFNICNHYEADKYISPPGSECYLEKSKYFGNNKNQKKLEYFRYEHPTWEQQFGDHIDYCSAIDLLLNYGDEGKNIITKGIPKK